MAENGGGAARPGQELEAAERAKRGRGAHAETARESVGLAHVGVQALAKAIGTVGEPRQEIRGVYARAADRVAAVLAVVLFKYNQSRYCNEHGSSRA